MILKKKLKRPRWLQRFKAFLLGYFWLQCPVCGKMFGGHEIGGTLWYDMGRSSGRCTCSECPGDYSWLEEQCYELPPRFGK